MLNFRTWLNIFALLAARHVGNCIDIRLSTIDQGGQPSTIDQGGQPSTIDQGGQPSTIDQGGQPSTIDQGGQPNSIFWFINHCCLQIQK